MAQRQTRFTEQEALNIQLGQGPSAQLDTTNAFTTKTGEVVVAITMVQDVQFDASGLVQEDNQNCFGTDGIDGVYDKNTPYAIGDSVSASLVFPAGLTIYGRWTTVTLDSGAAILYMGG